MDLIRVEYRYCKIDKMYEFGISTENSFFWFYLGLLISKSKINHLVHTSKNDSIQIYSYLFDWCDEKYFKQFKCDDAKNTAKKTVLLMEKFILNEAN